MASTDTPDERDPPVEAVPPLDVVDSRWWYWIAAYLVTTLLFIPFVVVAGFLFLSPIIVAGPGDPGVGAPLAIVFFLVALLVLGFGLLAFIIFLALPVALYMDARAVRQADLLWQPEPIVYAGAALLQFVVTPVVGFLVAIYYLYQRHRHVGVP